LVTANCPQNGALNLVFFSNFKNLQPRPFDILDDKTNSIGFRSTLNYKDTLWSVPFETSLGTEMALTIIPFLFSKFICFAIKVLLELNSVISNRKAATKLFFTSRFSLSEKLHLETGLAFNTTRYSLRDLLQQRKQFKLGYTFGEVVTAEQDSPIDY
jgi:iron complex outermembrane receptor protein